MKINCGPTQRERERGAEERWCKWHRWFAWRPARVGSGDCRWLEYVERKAAFVGEGALFEFTPCDCTYRAITTNHH